MSGIFSFRGHFLVTALLTFCYPVVPTLTFLAVFWVKGSESKAASAGRNENAADTTERNDENGTQPQTYKMLCDWARIAPIIEGGIEAPIQFIFQVCIYISYLHIITFCHKPAGVKMS